MSWLPQNASHVGQGGSFGSCLDDLCLCSYTRLCLIFDLALSCCFLAFFLLLPLPSLLFRLYICQQIFQLARASGQQSGKDQSAEADMLQAHPQSQRNQARLTEHIQQQAEERCGKRSPRRCELSSGSKVLVS